MTALLLSMVNDLCFVACSVVFWVRFASEAGEMVAEGGVSSGAVGDLRWGSCRCPVGARFPSALRGRPHRREARKGEGMNPLPSHGETLKVWMNSVSSGKPPLLGWKQLVPGSSHGFLGEEWASVRRSWPLPRFPAWCGCLRKEGRLGLLGLRAWEEFTGNPVGLTF